MRDRSPVEEAVRRYFATEGQAYRGQTLLVGVSGGPDSVCLLVALHRLAGELGLRLHVAHLHHGLRGAEADTDARYVRRLCRRLGLPCIVERRDVEAYRVRHRLSLEEAGRRSRHAFFARAAAQVALRRAQGEPRPIGAVLLGHTADDQVETVLMRLLRGTGITGLRGMLPVSRVEAEGTPITLLRPLLGVRRRQTEEYCRQHRLRPREDPTNRMPLFLRNRVRRELLPLLRRYNPSFDQALLRLARLAADDTEHLAQEARGLLGKMIIERTGRSARLAVERFVPLSQALRRYVVREAIALVHRAAKKTLAEVEAEHVEAALALAHQSVGAQVSLPGGLRALRGYHDLWLGYGEPPCPWPVLEGPDRSGLAVPGETLLRARSVGGPAWRVTARLVERATRPVSSDPWTACLDAGRTGTRLWVRAWQPGDRFRPLGMRQPKKLHDFFVDAKVPRAWRRRVPLLCCPEGIVWVAGHRIDERFKMRPETEKVLELHFSPVADSGTS